MNIINWQSTVWASLRSAILLHIAYRHEQHVIIQTSYLQGVLSPEQQLPRELRCSSNSWPIFRDHLTVPSSRIKNLPCRRFSVILVSSFIRICRTEVSSIPRRSPTFFPKDVLYKSSTTDHHSVAGFSDLFGEKFWLSASVQLNTYNWTPAHCVEKRNTFRLTKGISNTTTNVKL